MVDRKLVTQVLNESADINQVLGAFQRGLKEGIQYLAVWGMEDMAKDLNTFLRVYKLYNEPYEASKEARDSYFTVVFKETPEFEIRFYISPYVKQLGFSFFGKEVSKKEVFTSNYSKLFNYLFGRTTMFDNNKIYWSKFNKELPLENFVVKGLLQEINLKQLLTSKYTSLFLFIEPDNKKRDIFVAKMKVLRSKDNSAMYFGVVLYIENTLSKVDAVDSFWVAPPEISLNVIPFPVLKKSKENYKIEPNYIEFRENLIRICKSLNIKKLRW